MSDFTYSAEVQYYNAEIIEPLSVATREIAELKAERDRLRESLKESLSLIENMVGDLDMEFLSYYSEHRAVMKQAREALEAEG